MTDFSDLNDFAARAPELAAKLARAAQGYAVNELGKRFSAYAKDLTPVGGPPTSPGDRHPGQMLADWKGTPGAPTGTQEVTALANDAPYAAIINRGRKRGVTPIGATRRVRDSRHRKKLKPNPNARMLGSTQAPKGITGPVWRRLKAEREEISQIAIDRAEREAGG